MVAATTVHPSSCCYTRTGFRLGYGQGSCSAHLVCEHGRITRCFSLVPFPVPFLSLVSQVFFKVLFAVSIHTCTLCLLHYLLALIYLSLALSIKGFGKKADSASIHFWGLWGACMSQFFRLCFSNKLLTSGFPTRTPSSALVSSILPRSVPGSCCFHFLCQEGCYSRCTCHAGSGSCNLCLTRLTHVRAAVTSGAASSLSKCTNWPNLQWFGEVFQSSGLLQGMAGDPASPMQK